VAVRKAAIVTTALPWGFTVKGGRFFAEFGRLSTFQRSRSAVREPALVLDQFIGENPGDASSELAGPHPQYLALTLGAYNKIGAANDASITGSRGTSRIHLLGGCTGVQPHDSLGIDLG